MAPLKSFYLVWKDIAGERVKPLFGKGTNSILGQKQASNTFQTLSSTTPRSNLYLLGVMNKKQIWGGKLGGGAIFLKSHIEMSCTKNNVNLHFLYSFSRQKTHDTKFKHKVFWGPYSLFAKYSFNSLKNPPVVIASVKRVIKESKCIANVNQYAKWIEILTECTVMTK